MNEYSLAKVQYLTGPDFNGTLMRIGENIRHIFQQRHISLCINRIKAGR